MEKAIIYVRGHNQEMQEVHCRLYAVDNSYEVLFVTTDIKAVNNCDVLLVANASRISRDRFEYYKTINALKEKGIKVESVANHDDTVEFERLVKSLLK